MECLGVLLLLMFGLVAAGYWQGIRVPSRPVFQTAEWLDFTSRTWHTCTIYPGSKQPPVERSLPLSRLIVICFSESWVDSNEVEYIVALCEADHFMHRTRNVKDIAMTKLHEAKSEQAATDFALRLARLWNLPAWQDQLDRDYKHVSVRLDTQKKGKPQRRR